MICKKCGAEIKSGARFCPKCGELATTASSQSTVSNGSTPKALSAKVQSKAPLISSLCILIFSLMLIPKVSHRYMSFHACIFPIIICFLIWLYSTVLIIKGMKTALKSKKNLQHICPKCRKVTLHNKYGVCDTCKLDSISDAKFALVSDVLSAILFFIGISTINRSRDTFLIMLIIICILNALCILSAIYMYPAKLARRTEHTAATAIFWLNIFFGWTFLMWIVLMIWASNGRSEKTVIVQQNAVPQKSTQESFEELKRLKDMGMLTDEEFEAKRKELLTRI